MSIANGNNEVLLHEYQQRRSSVASFPIIMYLESVRGCPLSCIMCSVPERQGRDPRDIDTALLRKVEPYFKYLELLGIHGAGEPLLSKNLDFFIDAATANACILHFSTTATYLKPRVADRLLATKLSIVFSIHAGTSDTYRKIMGADLNRIIENVGYLTRRSNELGRRDNDFYFSYIVMKENIHEIDQFLRLADRAGVHRVRFMGLLPTKKIVLGTKREGTQFTFSYFDQCNRDVQDEFLAQMPRITALATDLGIQIAPGSMEFAAQQHASGRVLLNEVYRKVVPETNIFPLRKRSGSCIAPWMGQVHIYQSGDVGLCCNTSYTLGNLFEKDFADIWNDYRMRCIRDEFRNGVVPRACGYCKGIQADEYPIELLRQVELV